MLASSNVALRQSAKQSTLYARIIQDVMVDNAVPALRRRLPLRSGLDPAFVALIDFDKIKVFFGSLPPSWAISIYRALWGGWPTSARYHEENRMVPVCGCWRGSDHQRHYFWCPTIWEAVFTEARSEPWFCNALLADIDRGYLQPCSDACWVSRRLLIVEPCLSSAFLSVASQATYCILRFSFA